VGLVVNWKKTEIEPPHSNSNSNSKTKTAKGSKNRIENRSHHHHTNPYDTKAIAVGRSAKRNLKFVLLLTLGDRLRQRDTTKSTTAANLDPRESMSTAAFLILKRL
jgi:hypothetical protein